MQASFSGALYSLRVGKELVDDPEYQRRLKEGLLDNSHYELKDIGNKHKALLSVLIFVIATVFIVIFGSFDNLRPSHIIDGKPVTVDMASIIEILMLSAAALILLFTESQRNQSSSG